MSNISSKRLILRQIAEKDLKGMFDCYSNEEAMQTFGGNPLKDKKEVLEIINQNINMKKEKTGIRYVAYLKDTDILIGFVTLKKYNSKHCRGEIDYIVLPEHQGKGFATEVLTLFLNEIFTTWKLERVSAYVFLENIASCKLLEKLNFRNEGILRNWAHVKDSFYDTYSYSFLSADIKELFDTI